jgi:hypothetical protein
MADKTNPRKKPATQADVNKAYIQGLHDEEVIFLTTLLDKYSFEIDVVQVWNDHNKLQLEIAEGRVKIKDLLTALKDECGIKL